MYKKKLGAWNAFKNLRSSDVLQILRLKKARDADQKQSVFLVRGKIVDVHSLQVYLSRNPWLLARAETEGPLSLEAAKDVTCYSPNPSYNSASNVSNISFEYPKGLGSLEISRRFTALLPSPMNALRCPEIYSAPEDMFRALHSHLNRYFIARVWTSSGNQCWNARGRHRPSVLLNSFVDRVMTAALAVSRQVNPVIVRHALDASFSILVRIFRNPPPELIPKLLTLAIRLSRIGRGDISHILIRFSTDLCFALRGQRDCLSLFWQGMVKTDSNQQIDVTERVFALCLAEFKKQTSPSHDLPVSVYLSYFDNFERQKPPRAQLQSIKSQLMKTDHQLISRTLLASLFLERQLSTCKLELEEGNPEKAEAALLDLDADHVNLKDEPFRLSWLGYAQWVGGKTVEAEQSYRDGVLAAERTCARDILCEALFQLERFLSWTGRPLESEGVRGRRLQALQRAGSIVSIDAGDSGTPSSSRNAHGGPSIVKIYIASGASGENWRPGAFSELTGGPWALLKPGGNPAGRDGAHAVGGGDQLLKASTSVNPA